MNTSATYEIKQLLRIAPPNFRGNPNDVVAVAHAALQSLRDSGDKTFLFLRAVMELLGEAHAHEELLFHCITGLRQVMLHRWSSLGVEFRDTVRDYLLTRAIYGTQQTVQHSVLVPLPRSIILACYTSAASFWKRQWNQYQSDLVDSPSQEISTSAHALTVLMSSANHPSISRMKSDQDLLQHLETLIRPNSPQMASAAQFLSILIGEFMGKSVVQYHLPLEFHKKAHASFEELNGWLHHSLRLGMGALSHIISQHLTSAPIIASEALQHSHQDDALAVVQLIIDIMSWEFGSEPWDVGIPINSNSKIIIVKCPVSWRDHLIRPDMCAAIFRAHEMLLMNRRQPKLAHALRQLLLLLTSLSGAIFADDEQRKIYATYLLVGTLKLLSLLTSSDIPQSSELLDALTIVTRLIANFKLSLLVTMPSLSDLLHGITSTGTALLHAAVRECEESNGDLERMEHAEWRNEALGLILDGCVLLLGDPWLLYSGNEQSRKVARSALANALAPLYSAFLTCRVKIARLEEYFLVAHSTDLDEVREQISASDLEEEMTSVAALGRLNLTASLDCISILLQPVLLNLKATWDVSGTPFIDPGSAALLEETRLLTMALGHLLSDDNSGETPVIPESIILSCQGDPFTANAIASSVQSVMNITQIQAEKISVNPHNTSLSPLLASTFLWFLNRWAPAYILPIEYGSTDGAPSLIVSVWGPGDNACRAISFCVSCCLFYQIYWPQETNLQEKACSLLYQLAKRGSDMRMLLIDSQSFQQLAMLHCLTAGLRHTAPESDLEATLVIHGYNVPIEMARGFQRLSYDHRARILTTLLVTTSSSDTKAYPTSNSVFSHCLRSVDNGFQQLLTDLRDEKILASDLSMKDMASLCVALYGGVAQCSDVTEPEQIAAHMTVVLQDLSGLMSFYASDLVICEGLLKAFRDYAEFFVAFLDREQCMILFRASADLLRSYAVHNCANRVVRRPTSSVAEAIMEEEQSYNDILCAIQLLINLGTKDFLDVCSRASEGVESGQVTDIIFFGLHQIIPLMTKGLLQYPTLCTEYFSLVGFMMDTYPAKVCILPYELFNSLLESLLYGMSHVDSFVSKSSLRGITAIAREHLQSKALSGHLASHADILDQCTRRLLEDVVFQSFVWDRLEASGMVLLSLAAVNVNDFAAVVNGLTQHIPGQVQQRRLHDAFEKLLRVDVLTTVSVGGYHGRMHRMKFSTKFEAFVKDIHSFLITK